MTSPRLHNDRQKHIKVSRGHRRRGYCRWIFACWNRERTASGQNYFCVDSKTPRSHIERAFEEFTTREDIAIILINQHISEEIRYLVENYNGTIPSVLEIPSKGKAYDPRKDTISNV